MNELGMFFFCIMIFMLIQLLVNYYAFERKRIKIKNDSIWENINVTSPFYKQQVKIIEYTNGYVNIESEKTGLRKNMDLDNFLDDYKIIEL